MARETFRCGGVALVIALPFIALAAALAQPQPTGATTHSLLYDGVADDSGEGLAGSIRIDDLPARRVRIGDVLPVRAFKVIAIRDDELELAGIRFDCESGAPIEDLFVTLRKDEAAGVEVPCPPAWPTTVAEAAARLLGMLSEEERRGLRDTPRSELIRFHFGLGMAVRNRFGLWAGNEALLRSAASRDMHPDSASETIIEAAWESLQAEDREGAQGPARGR